MSAYTRVKSCIKDKDVLLSVLRDMGFEPYSYDTPQQLEDYHGRMRPDRAEVIIPRRQLNSASNDIGFRKTADGTYDAIISQFDSGYVFTSETLEDLKLRYNDKRALQIAKTHGMKMGRPARNPGQRQKQFQYLFAPR